MLFIFLTALPAAAQCRQKFTDLPAAPELLGFRLGMTREQIKAHVPQTAFGKTDPFGVSKTTINPSFDPKIDQTKFAGVRSISLDLLDERLTSLWIGYDEDYKVKSVEEFVQLISESLTLTGDWTPWRSRGQQLRCADFQIIVSTLAGGPTLRLLDLSAEDTVAARRQAKEEQDAAVEAAANDGEAIIGDRQSKTYFTRGCRPAKEIVEADKVVFETAEEAEKAGYKLAKACHRG